MRLLSADIIYDGLGNTLTKQVIVLENSGKIVAIIPIDIISEKSQIEYYSGFICPGFVNVHCHLELSHLAGQIKEATGIDKFIEDIVSIRNTNPETVINAALKADKKMQQNGIVAVGDICNTTHTVNIKQNSSITYYNFIELFTIAPAKAQQAFEAGLKTKYFFNKTLPHLKTSFTPHAPYSVSKELFNLINQSLTPTDVISIHSQESESENIFLKEVSGAMYQRFISWGTDLSHLKPGENTSLQTYFKNLKQDNQKLLIHNTFIKQADLDYLSQAEQPIFIGLCPNANLYIEQTLPPVELLMQYSFPICIGTDSLASNHQLSVYNELQTIKKKFPKIEWSELIKWGTYNGAKALRLDDKFGKLSPNLSPGIINVNPQNVITVII
ncbi:MAG: amidohydrolase family protein [Bacteroidia bacterium]|nr:amidohydrolase family protein [Bacteroidia bacterium]